MLDRSRSRLLAVAVLALSCGVNPVTGNREIQFVSESQEIATGAESYAPAQQAGGGPYVVEPALVEYVEKVGEKLAAASDRPSLPYEFTIVNGSDPNAWALPGGKIALHRGLLLALESEAELAAVLGHEIVHAAARHGAKEMERGLLMQIGLAGLEIALSDQSYGGLAVGGAAIAAGLASARYGRSQELDADRYGMTYLSRAGYDPQAAVSVQEKFVRLFAERKPGWIEGFFASHPPSEERVAANRATAASLPAGGEIGRNEYRRQIAALARAKAAYEAYDRGEKALAEGRTEEAERLANRAIDSEPREAAFYGLRGEAQMARGRPRAAIRDFDAAIDRNAGYFEFFVQRGLARKKDGDESGARADLDRSVRMFPTDVAHFALAEMALADGDERAAIPHLQVAASSEGPIGKEAQRILARYELPEDPSGYLQAQVYRESDGQVVVQVFNRSPVAVRDVEIEVEQVNRKGKQVKWDRVSLNRRIAAGSMDQTRTSLFVEKRDLKRVEARVTSAEPAED